MIGCSVSVVHVFVLERSVAELISEILMCCMLASSSRIDSVDVLMSETDHVLMDRYLAENCRQASYFPALVATESGCLVFDKVLKKRSF